MFIVLARTWDKEKILSPHEGSNLRPSDSALRCSATMMVGIITATVICEAPYTAEI